jgi:transposase
MEAAWLQAQLEAGRSIESIARETGRAASTVAYWVNKHGLTSRHAPRHRAKGGLSRDQLEPLVAAGVPIRAMAEQLGVSYTTVRHWLARHGLATARAERLAVTAAACCAATTGRLLRSSSTIRHLPTRPSTSLGTVSRGRWIGRSRRPASASCSARHVTPRSRLVSLHSRKPLPISLHG